MKIQFKLPKLKNNKTTKAQKIEKKHLGKKSVEERLETKVISKKGLIISSAVAGSAVAIGIAVTLVLINPNLFPPVAPDLGDLNINELDDDNTALFSKYKKLANVSDYSSIFEPVELVKIALDKASQHEHLMTTSCGTVKASIATQTVASMYVRNGDERMYENISDGFVKVGLRFYQNLDGVSIYTGTNVNTFGATWSESNKQDLSISEYEEIWGKDLTRRTIYIISSKTVLDTSKTEKTDTGYDITLDLEPNYCSRRYVKQIIHTSGLAKEPIFYSVSLTYHLDNELNIKTVDMNSNYHVYAFGWVISDEHLEEVYYYDEYAIPSLTEDCPYKED